MSPALQTIELETAPVRPSPKNSACIQEITDDLAQFCENKGGSAYARNIEALKNCITRPNPSIPDIHLHVNKIERVMQEIANDCIIQDPIHDLLQKFQIIATRIQSVFPDPKYALPQHAPGPGN